MSTIQQDPILDCLQNGSLTVEGQFMWGSNYTFLAEVKHNDQTLKAVYKPTQGEKPLWDFPTESLAGREVGAYFVSEALGWQLVPPTVLRTDGPAGLGSLQLFIEHDPEYHYFNFSNEDRQLLRPVALFDIIINNTDRKGSHVLVDEQGKFWLIDHGICFHASPKLRTVIWDFAGQLLSEEDIQELQTFRKKLKPGSGLVEKLSEFLVEAEIQAMDTRINTLITQNRFPTPTNDYRSYPWPPV